MHELGVVFHIIKSVKEVANENKVSKVNKVVLEVGEVSAIVNVYLQDCWKWACSKEEIMNGCELKIEPIKAITFCEDCKNTFSTIENGKKCPYCGSENTYLLKGQEVNIKEIEDI